MIENDEIAVDVAHGNCLRVGQGAWCLIGQVVAGGDDAPGRGGEDARAVAHPASHFLQVAHHQPPLGVGPHEVDGEPLGVEQLAVDGLNRAAMDPRVATATVDDEPAPALERRPEDVGLLRRQRKWGQAVLDRRWRVCCRADRRERLDPVVEEPGDRAEGKSRDNKTTRDSLGGRSRFEAGRAFSARSMPRSCLPSKRKSLASCSRSSTSTACRVAGTALALVRTSSYTT